MLQDRHRFHPHGKQREKQFRAVQWRKRDQVEDGDQDVPTDDHDAQRVEDSCQRTLDGGSQRAPVQGGQILDDVYFNGQRNAYQLSDQREENSDSQI